MVIFGCVRHYFGVHHDRSRELQTYRVATDRTLVLTNRVGHTLERLVSLPNVESSRLSD